jgi:hypothetical protein
MRENPHRLWTFSRSFERVMVQPPIVDGRFTYNVTHALHVPRAVSRMTRL